MLETSNPCGDHDSSAQPSSKQLRSFYCMNRSDRGSIHSKSTGLMATIAPGTRQSAGPVDTFIDASGAHPEPSKVRCAESERMHG